jgi:histidinol dehydrogenase
MSPHFDRAEEQLGPLRFIGTWDDLDDPSRSKLTERGLDSLYDDDLREQISQLVDDVKRRGDAAVSDALRRFDGCDVAPEELRLTDEELDKGLAATPEDVLNALNDAIDHSRRFNERLCEQGSWQFEIDPGLTVGEQVGPIESAGLFVPSGKGSFPSVLVQLAVPAQVAGVDQLTVCVPPAPGGSGEVDPAVLAVCRLLGLQSVFRANGPAGVAAMAFGTESIPKVRLVVGPGSPAVSCAQVEVQRYGTVTTMVLGPTESLVIADDTANVDLLAADLLNEAEHGSDSMTVLVTTAPECLAEVQARLAERLRALPEPRRSFARDALGINGGVVIARDVLQAAEVANAFACEHVQIVVADPDPIVAAVTFAGEILIGQHTPFSAANYVLGCPASLPTSGFAKISSGVTADTFRRRTSVATADGGALRRVRDSIVALAQHEGFPAHVAAVTARDA